MSKIFERSGENHLILHHPAIIIFFFYSLSATDINPIAAQCTLKTAKENGVNICTVITDLVSQLIHLPPTVAIKREKFTKINIFIFGFACLSCEIPKMQALLSFFFVCACCVCFKVKVTNNLAKVLSRRKFLIFSLLLCV